MKLAIYISGMSRGGTEKKVSNISNYMIGHGHEVVLVNAYRFEEEFEVNAAVKRLICEPTEEELPGNRIGNFIARYKKLRKIWIDEKPDVILSFIGKTNMMTLLTSRGLGIPVAVGVVGNPEVEYYTRSLKLIARILYRRADVVILQTKQSMSFFPKKVLDKAIIMKNPVSKAFDVDRYEGVRDKTIITLSRIEESKDHIMVIDVFAKIADEYPDWNLIIYGEGPLKEELTAKVKELGLSDRILFPGRTDNVAETIKKAGVFILPSFSEGSPNSLIEAMMLGLPVISTDCPCGGPAELIEDGVNGLLIPVDDREKLQESLQKIINNPHFAEQIGRESAKTRAIYSPDRVFEAWEQMLTGLANKGKADK